jgi:hypothetical protein
MEAVLVGYESGVNAYEPRESVRQDPLVVYLRDVDALAVACLALV